MGKFPSPQHHFQKTLYAININSPVPCTARETPIGKTDLRQKTLTVVTPYQMDHQARGWNREAIDALIAPLLRDELTDSGQRRLKTPSERF